MRAWIYLLGLAVAIGGGGLMPAGAQPTTPPGVMPPAQIRAALDLTRDKWIAFRNYDGRQWIYFTEILSWHCGLKEIRYSLDGDDLGERFAVPACNPQAPFQLDPQKDRIYLALAPGSVRSLSVQLVYVDGVESPVRRYGPCEVKGDTTCGLLLQ